MGRLVNDPLFSDYDEKVFTEISRGTVTIDTIEGDKSVYLIACIYCSDDAFVQAIQSGIPFPTKEGDIYDLVSEAYYLGREKSLQLLKPLCTPERLSHLLNVSISEWVMDDFLYNDQRYQLRLIQDGASLSPENREILMNESAKFIERSHMLNKLLN